MNNSNSTEPMDQYSFSGSESIAWSDTNEYFVSEILDPYICMWDGCRQAFDMIQDFVQHIKVAHIEVGRSKKRGGYVCLWDHCEGPKKPYCYRSNLLKHIRIKHCGEDPIVSKTI